MLFHQYWILYQRLVSCMNSVPNKLKSFPMYFDKKTLPGNGQMIKHINKESRTMITSGALLKFKK